MPLLLSEVDDHVKFRDAVLAKWGKIDNLILNAGVTGTGVGVLRGR
jgi:NAD(P)-dependent dehydrogenase (short-subunit alcohol dehydrogenase family)